MRAYLIAAAVAVTSTVGADSPYLKGSDLQAKIALDCADGCVTFNSEQATEFEEHLQKLLADKVDEAFKAGVRYQQQACASLI